MHVELLNHKMVINNLYFGKLNCKSTLSISKHVYLIRCWLHWDARITFSFHIWKINLWNIRLSCISLKQSSYQNNFVFWNCMSFYVVNWYFFDFFRCVPMCSGHNAWLPLSKTWFNFCPSFNAKQCFYSLVSSWKG